MVLRFFPKRMNSLYFLLYTQDVKRNLRKKQCKSCVYLCITDKRGATGAPACASVACMTRDKQWLLEEKYAGKATASFEEDKKRLATGEPLGFIIGWQPFLGLKIHLDSHPLIPRPETEWWVEQMLQGEQGDQKMGVRLGLQQRAREHADMSSCPHAPRARQMEVCKQHLAPRSAPIFGSPCSRLKFLDLCAGSGAIGCAALARLPDARVYFGEIDPAHEATILKNIRENNLDESRAGVRIGDLFEPFDMTFDIIATNPPYIPSGRTLDGSVADYEPAQALYAGDDGLAIIRRIAAELPQKLAPGGEAWIEVDSSHADAAAALFEERGLRTSIRTDQYGRPRTLVITFP